MRNSLTASCNKARPPPKCGADETLTCYVRVWNTKGRQRTQDAKVKTVRIATDPKVVAKGCICHLSRAGEAKDIQGYLCPIGHNMAQMDVRWLRLMQNRAGLCKSSQVIQSSHETYRGAPQLFWKENRVKDILRTGIFKYKIHVTYRSLPREFCHNRTTIFSLVWPIISCV